MTTEYEVKVYRGRGDGWHWHVIEKGDFYDTGYRPWIQQGWCFTRWGARAEVRRAIRQRHNPARSQDQRWTVTIEGPEPPKVPDRMTQVA